MSDDKHARPSIDPGGARTCGGGGIVPGARVRLLGGRQARAGNVEDVLVGVDQGAQLLRIESV